VQSSRIPQLDAIRGIAILVVMFHNERDVFPSLHLSGVFASGWMGVDLFFVLSGFLITGILLDAKGSAGFFRTFYARRSLRIWPLYYALLLFMFVAVPLLRPANASMIFERSSPWWAYPFYLQNFLVPVSSDAAGALGVTWSLAIEEQFYLVWPLVVRYLSTARLRIVCLAVIVASPLLRWFLSTEQLDLYTDVFCRLDGLMWGAFLAALVREPAFEPRRHRTLAWGAFIIALPLALATDGHNLEWLVCSLSVLAWAGLVYLALFSTAPWLQRILRSRALVFTGTISYGLYLLHKIPFDAAKGRSVGHPTVVFAVLMAAAYVLATTSWYLYERPFLRLKRFFEAPQPRAHEEAGSLARVLQGEPLEARCQIKPDDIRTVAI
jgi:peptidoglycan/LPS O-acetylase OafA/YrhL